MMATENIYYYYTQLVSTIDVLQHVSKHDVRLAIYFGGPRPGALSVNHAFGAVLKTRLGDGCLRGWGRSEEF
jgi:hypothetical protein